MNRVDAHLLTETLETELTLKSTDSMGREYRVLHLGFNLSLYLNDKQLEQIFDVIDSRLHPQTYTELLQALEIAENKISEKDDQIYDLQSDLDDALDLIEMFEDNINEK